MKKLLAMLLVLPMLVSCITITHAATLPAVGNVQNPLTDCNEFTPAENVFKIEGDDTEFILMKTTKKDESKFFVTTKRDYGLRQFDPDKTQKFDVEDENNIAYWLNNDFITTGAEDGSKLPQEIIDHINFNHVWDTEAGRSNGNCPVGYSTTAGVALMSQTEYLDVYRKIGLRDDMEKTSNAWWLRTPFASGASEDILLVVKISEDTVNGRTIQWGSANKLLVRPVFYLDKAFFGAVKVQVPSVGKAVKKAITSNFTNDQLAALGYTEAEIEMLNDTSLDVSEQFSMEMETEAIGGMVEPEKAKFDITAIVGGQETKEYTVLFQCEELGIPATYAKMQIEPGVETKKTFTLKNIKNGIGRLIVNIKDGDRLCSIITKDIFVMPRYEEQFMDAFSEHAMGTHYPQQGQSNDDDTYMLHRAGVKKIRDSVLWQTVETEKGKFEFDWLDRFVFPLPESGIDITAIIGLNNTLYMSVAPTTSDEISAFCNYVDQILTRYPHIRQIEIWNEPNLRSFWKPDPLVSEYMKLMKAAASVIRKHDPTIKILGGSINATDTKFLNGMYERGAFPFMDYVSYHPYITPAEVDEKYRASLQKMEDAITENGGWKESFVTEIGWPTHIAPTGNTEEKQALEIPKMYIVSDSMSIKGNAVYSFKDSGNNDRENEDRFGLIRRNINPKKSYLSLTQLNMMLGGAVYVGELNMDGKINAHVYMKDHKPLIAMWTTEGDTVTNFDFGAEEVEVVDLIGNKVEPVSGNTYAINREIYYVTNLDKSWFNKAVAEHTGNRLDSLLKTWSEKLPAEVVANLTAVRDYARSLAARAELPSEAEISDMITQHYGQGDNLLTALRDKTIDMTEVEVSGFLFNLHRAGEGLSRILAATSTSNSAITSTSRLDNMLDMIETRSAENLDGSLQYTEAITSYARGFSEDAVKIKNLAMSNPSKAGIIKSYDRLSNELMDWAELWETFEQTTHTAFMLEVGLQDTSIFTGETKNISVGIRSTCASPTTGVIKLFDQNNNVVATSDEIEILPDQVTKADIAVLFDKVFPGGKQDFTFKLFHGEEMLDFAIVTFKSQDKVAVSLEPQSGALDSVKEVTVNLTSLYDQSLTGNVTIEPPEGWTLASNEGSYSVGAEASTQVTFKVANTSKRPFNYYTFKVSLTDQEGKQIVSVNAPLSFTVIPKSTVSVAPTEWDGNMSDWADAYPIFINVPQQANDLADWQNTDISGMAFAKWDDDYFYFLGNIYDDAYAQTSSGGGLWAGDSIQFSIDCNDTKSSSGYDLDDFEIGISYTKDGMEIYCSTASADSEGGSWDSDYLYIYRDETSKVTRSYVRIPKEKLAPLEMQAGKKIGFNVGLNDADVDSRETYVQFTRGTCDNKNPSLYKTFTMISNEIPAQLSDIEKFSLPIELVIDTKDNFKDFGQIRLAVDDEKKTSLFEDIEGHWAKTDIEYMAKRNIVSGVSETLFEPERNITRSEFIALLAKAGIEESPYGGNLSDVGAEDWYAGYIQSGIDSGVIPQEMLAGGVFKPDQPITREEMAVMVVNMYAYKTGSALQPGESVFKDEGTFSSWTVDAINAAYKEGIVTGVSQDTFDAVANATRAEAVVIVKRLLAKL